MKLLRKKEEQATLNHTHGGDGGEVCWKRGGGWKRWKREWESKKLSFYLSGTHMTHVKILCEGVSGTCH